MQFKQFYKVFLEKRNFYYTIPVSKEKLLYDFYTIEMLNHYVKKRFNPNRPDEAPMGFDEDDPESVSVKEAREILVPFLKKEMLDAMFVSCACEIRHVIDLVQLNTKEESVLDKLTPQNKKVFLYYKKYYNNLIERYAEEMLTVTDTPDSLGDRYSPRNNKVYALSRGSGRILSVKSANKTAKEYGKPAVVRMFHEMFQLDVWPPSFGGKPWADIAECYLDLSDTTKSDLNQMTVYIDRAYDLQHNTGSVFNKLKTYLGKGAYDWIAQALDFKYSANPWNLSAKSSGILPRLSKIILAKARAERPSEEDPSSYSVVYKELLSMSDEEFDNFIRNDTDLISFIPTNNVVNDKHYYEKINELSKDFADSVIKRVIKMKDTSKAKFFIAVLIGKFPFKFYSQRANAFLNEPLNRVQIWNAKNLVSAFYKEPDWRTANPEFLEVLKEYISSDNTIASFFVKTPSDLNNSGDRFAAYDVVAFLTNLQASGKLPADDFVDAIIDSYKTSDLYTSNMS